MNLYPTYSPEDKLKLASFLERRAQDKRAQADNLDERAAEARTDARIIAEQGQQRADEVRELATREQDLDAEQPHGMLPRGASHQSASWLTRR